MPPVRRVAPSTRRARPGSSEVRAAVTIAAAAARRKTIREWAAHQHPIELAVDAIDVFPAPWQIVIARLARTDALVAAYASLTDALAETGFRRLDERPLEEWTFHLSMLYGKTLDAAEWAPFAASAVRELPDGPACTVAEAELVSYEAGIEHAEVITLG